MTKETFKAVMDWFDAAYPKQHLFDKEITGKVWWECLKDLNDKRAMEAVTEVIQTEDFPTIAKIRAAATYWKPSIDGDKTYSKGIIPQPKKKEDIDWDELEKQWAKELEEIRNG